MEAPGKNEAEAGRWCPERTHFLSLTPARCQEAHRIWHVEARATKSQAARLPLGAPCQLGLFLVLTSSRESPCAQLGGWVTATERRPHPAWWHSPSWSPCLSGVGSFP